VCTIVDVEGKEPRRRLLHASIYDNMQSGTAENSMELRRRSGGDMWGGIDYALRAFKVVTWL